MVSTTPRVAVFQAIYDALNADPPTYTYDGDTYTYTILSAFPSSDPVYPCLIINPIVMDTKKLGVTQTVDKKSAPATVEMEFFAKSSHLKGAIDTAKDYAQRVLEQTASTAFFITRDGFEDDDSDVTEYDGQKLNTGVITMNIKVR